MGGRSAEEIFLGHITTGAGNDIERATDIARNMVCEWGMSDLGPLAFGKKEEAIFLGREIAQHRDFSEDTALQIDREVKRIVSDGYEKAKSILSSNRELLDRIAQALLVREVLDANEVKTSDGRQAAAGQSRGQPPTPPPTAGGARDRSEGGSARDAPGTGLHARRFSGEGLIQTISEFVTRGPENRAPTFLRAEAYNTAMGRKDGENLNIVLPVLPGEAGGWTPSSGRCFRMRLM